MHAQYSIVDQGGHGKTVEAIREYFPEPDVEPAFALVVEAVDAVDGGAFMVPSQQEEVLRVLDFVS